jgi:hypothetical protein
MMGAMKQVVECVIGDDDGGLVAVEVVVERGRGGGEVHRLGSVPSVTCDHEWKYIHGRQP